MQGTVNIGQNASDIHTTTLQDPYSRVTIIVSDERSYTAGNDTGTELVLTCPWGTQTMANNILAKVRGIQYQPMDIQNAYTNPAIELGDGIFANSVRGAVYVQDFSFGKTMYNNISSPQEEQLDSEFTFESPLERQISRQNDRTKAELKILDDAIKLEVQERQEDSSEFRGEFQTQAQQISARVTQTGGTNSTFGWSLKSDKFELYSGSRQVFLCNKDGITVNGKIVAKSGIIGANADGTGGFTIKANYMCTNSKPSYNDTTISGVFVGTTGIGLGKGTFTVSSAGKLTASDATLTGTITAKAGKIGVKADGTGGFTINANYIASGSKTTYNDNKNDGVFIGTTGIGLGKNVFTVTSAGKLTATDATITGKVTATSGSFKSGTFNTCTFNSDCTFKGALSGATGNFSGKITAKEGSIGGFTILSNCLHINKPSGIDDVTTSSGVYLGTSGISVGRYNSGTSASPSYVDAFKVTSSGTFYARYGYIGDGTNGFYVRSKSIYNGKSSLDNTGNAEGVYLGVDGISLGRVGAGTTADPYVTAFKVTKAGKLTAQNADIKGKITATSGSFASGTFNTCTFNSDCTFKGALSGATGNFSGKITATEGYIGTSSNGFVIKSNYIHKNKDGLDNVANSSGIYIGTDGISLGRTNIGTSQSPNYIDAFKVTSSGSLFAANGDFRGTVYLSNLAFTDESGNTVTISGRNLTDGTVEDDKIDGVSGSKVGSGIAGGNINNGSIAKGKTSSSVQTSLENGDAAKDKIDDLCAGRITASVINSTTVNCTSIGVKKGGSYYGASWLTKTISGTSIEYLGR